MNDTPTTTLQWRNIKRLKIGWHIFATVIAFSMIYALVLDMI